MLDRDALHRILYRRADKLGRLKLNILVLASELDVNHEHLTRIVIEMTAQGRLRRIGGGKRSVKTFVVNDPAPFAGQGMKAYHRSVHVPE